MPSYNQQIRRIPKLGKGESVLQRSIERFKSLNRRGNVNFTISASGKSEGAVTTDIPCNAPSDLESFRDAFRSSPDSIEVFDESAEECSKAELHMYRVVKPVSSHKEAQNTILEAYSSLKEVKFKML